MGFLDYIRDSGIGDFISETLQEFGDVVIEKGDKKMEEMQKVLVTLDNPLDSMWTFKNIWRAYFADDVTPVVGDHIFVQRLGYTHHGLYIGNESVIHYSDFQVKVDTLRNFAIDVKVLVKSSDESPKKYKPNEIIERAKSRIGEEEYDLIYSNCEHFARWCRNGD